MVIKSKVSVDFGSCTWNDFNLGEIARCQIE